MNELSNSDKIHIFGGLGGFCLRFPRKSLNMKLYFGYFGGAAQPLSRKFIAMNIKTIV